MKNVNLQSITFSFCIAGAIALFGFIAGIYSRAEIIWMLLFGWPLVAGFGLWQLHRIKQQATDSERQL